ncbi:MAG: GGDEF domain-containing protein [Treponemataceae bacterium]
MSKTKSKYLNILKTANLFEGLDKDEIKAIAEKMYYCEFDKNSSLVYEGEMGNELYIVVEGKVDISIEEKSETTKQQSGLISVAKIGEGDFFGEMSMLEQEPRSATCMAISSVKALVLKSKDFLSLIEDNPKLAGKVLTNMLSTTASRLMSTNSFVTQLIQWGETAKKRAVTDSLTGLFNRRYFDTYIETILSGARDEKLELNFAMLDLDHFGSLNKKYGASFCDNILVQVSKIFKSSFSENDIIIRYGGDEFCFFIYGKHEVALLQCKLTCMRVNSLVFPEHPELKISCSMGLLAYDKKSNSKELVKIADDKLYKAKEAGRNQVVW